MGTIRKGKIRSSTYHRVYAVTLWLVSAAAGLAVVGRRGDEHYSHGKRALYHSHDTSTDDVES